MAAESSGSDDTGGTEPCVSVVTKDGTRLTRGSPQPIDKKSQSHISTIRNLSLTSAAFNNCLYKVMAILTTHLPLSVCVLAATLMFILHFSLLALVWQTKPQRYCITRNSQVSGAVCHYQFV